MIADSPQHERAAKDMSQVNAGGKLSSVCLLHLNPADAEGCPGHGDVLRDSGCEVSLAAIEFAERFKTFPMSRPFLEVRGAGRPAVLDQQQVKCQQLRVQRRGER